MKIKKKINLLQFFSNLGTKASLLYSDNNVITYTNPFSKPCLTKYTKMKKLKNKLKKSRL